MHDFFSSIDERKVFSIFLELGYPRLLSFELARLCTRNALDVRGLRVGRAPYLRVPKGSLPQGSPTSGALANAAVLDVDEELTELAEQRGLTYSRYSDDLTLSAVGDLTRTGAAAVVRDVAAILARAGLRVHRRKTAVVPPGARKIVLGLVVLNDRVALPAQFKRRLQVHVRGVHKFGLIEHARHRGFRSVLSMVEHIDGCIAFAMSIDASFAGRIKADWEHALGGSDFPRT
jgi:hypothetical protein